MLFEFSIARKYLIPKRGQLSSSLIALMSVGVISLVVWLVLVFLSVTDGIEKTWLKKLTSLNAPIHITPTPSYYSSYYYQIDEISHLSGYASKSIGEKREALLTNPYSHKTDPALPAHWPEQVLNEDGSPKDLVKLAFSLIEGIDKNLITGDDEITGAMLKLRMVRPHGASFRPNQEKTAGHLAQASYISSFCEKNPSIHRLIEPPRVEDLNHLFFLSHISSPFPPLKTKQEIRQESRQESRQASPLCEFQQRIKPLLCSVTIKEMRTTTLQWHALFDLLPEGVVFDAFKIQRGGLIHSFCMPLKKWGKRAKQGTMIPGKLLRKKQKLIFTSDEGEEVEVEVGRGPPLVLEAPLTMQARYIPTEIETLTSLSDIEFEVKLTLQGKELEGKIPWEGIEIAEGSGQMLFDAPPKVPPPWAYLVRENKEAISAVLPQKSPHEVGIILSKYFQRGADGVKIGDVGYFSYGATTISSLQEQQLPLVVTGFYDPGVMAIGGKAILTSDKIVHTINAASQSFLFDQTMTNGIQVWFNDLSQTNKIHDKLTKAFDKAGILPYWTITPYYDYPFARDLFLQFQSDKHLFTLIGGIVLIVACSNIISLLVILVSDKKREIAILGAMGASKKSIALIFTLCGAIMGMVSALIGTGAALLTLHHIDSIVHFLSFLQGHEAFNAIFYGKSLPNTLSHHALLFILISTPIISFLAALVPALKASKFHLSKILRSEG